MSTITRICSTERQVHPFTTVAFPLLMNVHWYFTLERDETFILVCLLYGSCNVNNSEIFPFHLHSAWHLLVLSWLVTTGCHSSLSPMRYICATTTCQNLLRAQPRARKSVIRPPSSFALKFNMVVYRSTYCALPSTGYCSFLPKLFIFIMEKIGKQKKYS